MSRMRFNHMELSFPRGTLTKEFRDEVDAFFCGVLGWDSLDTEVVGQSCHLLRPDDGQFILLAESGKPMSSPGYDHLGLLMDTRDEVDAMLAECQRFAEKDDRLQIKEYEDLTGPTITVHAFYVKYLLPDLVRRAIHGVAHGQGTGAALAVCLSGDEGGPRSPLNPADPARRSNPLSRGARVEECPVDGRKGWCGKT